MDGERAILEEQVFPELRRRAEGLVAAIEIVDPAGATSKGFDLTKRFREIDACRPFFVGILGERYGDPPVIVPPELRDRHLWIASDPGRSTLELEILHGVLNDPGAAWQSFFYLRDPRFPAQMPESKRWKFLSENARGEARLASLKDRIRLSGRPVFASYPCTWSETLERAVDLEAFAERVLADLWQAVQEEDLEAPPLPLLPPAFEADPLQEMREEAERVLSDILDESTLSPPETPTSVSTVLEAPARGWVDLNATIPALVLQPKITPLPPSPPPTLDDTAAVEAPVAARYLQEPRPRSQAPAAAAAAAKSGGKWILWVIAVAAVAVVVFLVFG
jgi:hypothetical protein